MERKNLKNGYKTKSKMKEAAKMSLHFSEVPVTPERPSESSLNVPSRAQDVTEARDAISSHKLYVSNLPDDVSFGDIQTLFPTALSVVMDNRSKQVKSAIVEFANWKTCEEVLNQNKRTKLKDKVLVVSPKASS